MDKIMAIATREFMATVRTRAFLLTVVLMPALIVGAIFGTQWVETLSAGERVPVRRLAIVDRTGQLHDALAMLIDGHNTNNPNQRFELEQLTPGDADVDELTARVRGGDLYGYILVNEDALALDGDGCQLARKDNQLHSGQLIEQFLTSAIFAVRLHQAGIDPIEVSAIRTPVPFEWLDAKTGQPVNSNMLARAVTPFAFMFLLFMGTFGISQGLLTTVIEEKSSRVVEVLLSAVSSTQLMAGKILGMAVVGMVLIVVWGGVGYISGRTSQLGDLVNGYRLAIAVLYFVPGFLLMAALLAGIGSVCNELKEAQSMVFPLSLITVVPMIFWMYISQYPGSVVSIALSYVPPITPFIMILRVCSDPDTPLWQIISTLALLWASVCFAIWAAGKVFRIGVLMYGKPPSLWELLHWVRHS